MDRSRKKIEWNTDRVLMFLQKVAEIIAWFYVIAIGVMMPFYFTRGYAVIGSDKARFFRDYGFPILRAGTVVLLLWALCLLVAVYKQEKLVGVWNQIRKKMSLTDWFAVGYGVVLLLSFWCSNYQDKALYGNEKWPLGLTPQLAFLASYFLLSRAFTGGKQFFSILWKVITLVFGLAILHRFGLYPFAMEYASSAFISTIGNINWFCGYWSVVGMVFVIFFWKEPVLANGKNALSLWGYGSLATLSLLTGVLQGSDSGVFTIGMVFALLFMLSWKVGDRMQRFWELGMMVCGGCMVAGIVNLIFPTAITYRSMPMDILLQTPFSFMAFLICFLLHSYVKKRNAQNLYPAAGFRKAVRGMWIGLAGLLALYLCVTLLNTFLPQGLGSLYQNSYFTFNIAWASNRGGTWWAAAWCWWQQNVLHKLIGVGPDCMADAIYSGQTPALLALVREQFPSHTLLNAHQEWLTILVNTGLLGLIGFGGMVVGFIKKMLRAGQKNPLFYVFALCVFAYTMNNIFSFQTTMNVTHLFLLMGIGEGIWRKETHGQTTSK